MEDLLGTISPNRSLERASPYTVNWVPVLYRGQRIGGPFRLDFLVEGTVIVELKAVETVHPIHRAQLITYLKLTKSPIGLLINFHVPHLKDGIERMMNTRTPGSKGQSGHRTP